MLDIILRDAQVFTLVLVRLSSFLAITPFFGYRNIPVPVKVALMALLTLMLTPIIAADPKAALYGSLPFADLFLVMLKEFMVGILLGLTATLIFSAVQIGGMFIDLQIGYAMANVFDPMSGTTAPLTGQFKYVLAMLVFLGFDGQQGLLTAILQSYKFVPIGQFHMTGNLLSVLMQTFSTMFLLGLKIAIPIIAALFLTDVGLAVLSRAVPQMNVFVLGMPIKLIVGGLMMVVVMPAVIYLLRGLFHTMFAQMDALLRVMGG